MAQVVGFFEDNVVFAEGPFVISNPCASGWRIEAELKGHHCPVLPDPTIYKLKASLGMHNKTLDRDLAVRVCDALNQLVRDGEIVLEGRMWTERKDFT